MANLCYTYATFNGARAREMSDQLQDIIRESGKETVDFIWKSIGLTDEYEGSGWISDITVSSDDEVMITIESKWDFDEDYVIDLAEKYELEIHYLVEEPGTRVFRTNDTKLFGEYVVISEEGVEYVSGEDGLLDEVNRVCQTNFTEADDDFWEWAEEMDEDELSIVKL